MVKYKLLTPGPLTTTDTVKREMLVDHCTWDDDYKQITQEIRAKLLNVANASKEKYTAVLMQGSGTFGVESVLTSSVGHDGKLLIISNGSYGKRMEEISKYAGLNYVLYTEDYDKKPSVEKIEQLLKEDELITHVSMVHCETTSGILNNIEEVANAVKAKNKIFIVDAMSSFGGIVIPVEKLEIDFLVSSSNKCIQGVPGFSFVICNRDVLEDCKGKSHSLSLDLYAQFSEMEKNGKWRFTSPTHVVIAFAEALKELEAEGGVAARQKRYTENNKLLIKNLTETGFKTYIDAKNQSPIITSFLYPDNKNFTFGEMYDFIKERGYAIYPGKVTDADTFRIGNIGEIYKEDVEKITDIFNEFMQYINRRN